MPDLRTTCGHDCSCPSRLYHDMDSLIRRQEAPIPPMSMHALLSEMREALDEELERSDPALAMSYQERQNRRQMEKAR